MADMTPQQRKERLLATPVEDINDTYRKGYITALDKNALLRQKATVTLEQTIADKGILGAIYSQSIKNLQDGWENLKEAATRTPTQGHSGQELNVKNELYYVGLAMWGQIQMLTSAMTAVGEVTGKVAEMQSIKAGASPGLAKAIGFAVDIGSGFAVPTGLASRGFAKGVQKIGAKKAAKVAAEPAKEGVDVINKVLAEGLEADGVKGAEKIIAKGAGDVEETGAKIIRETEEAIAKATPPSAADQFAADLKKYQAELANITEPQTHEMTARMAAKLGLHLDDLKSVVPGQALNEREMYAYLKALEPRIQEATALAEKVMDGTEASAHAFASYMSELFTFAPKFRGAEVTAGRSVEILKESPPMKAITDMLTGWDAEKMADGNFIGAITTMAEDWLAMAKEQPRTAEALVAVTQSNWHRFKENGWPMIREAYTNLLLSRPTTQVKNFLGNSIAAANGIAERFAGGMFSADRGTGLVASEAFSMSKGMMLALGDGLQAFGRAFSKMTPEDAAKLDFMPGAIPGTLGRIIRTPGNALQGMDNFFKTLFRRGSYYAQATREGAQKGLNGDDLAAFVSRRVNHPTEAMLKEGNELAYAQTFQNELGTLGKKAQSLAQAGPLALFFPFMKTPINLAKYAWNRTPGLQLMSSSLYKDILEGGVRADMAIGRLTVSNLTAMFLFEMAKDGMITGSGPIDPALRRVWLTTNQPYSVRVGGIPEKTKEGRVVVKNKDGTYSTEKTATVEIDGRYYNVPTMFSGKDVSIEEAIRRVESAGWKDPETGRKLQAFASIKEAESEAQKRTAQLSDELKTGAWIPLTGMEPGTTTLGMIADFASVLNQLDEPTAGQAGMALTFALMNDLVDKTYWQTVSDLVDVAGGASLGHAPGKSRRDVLIGPLITTATGGPLVSSIARTIDPIKREVRTVMDNAFARVPGYTKSIPPDRDPYGDPILYPQAVGSQWLGMVSPFTEKPFTTDRVKLEGAKLQIKTPDFPWTMGGSIRDDFDIRAPFPEDKLPVELTNQQRDRWQQIYRDNLRHPKHGIESTLLDRPEYQKATRAMKRELFMDAMADYRSVARDAIQVEDTELGRKILENDAKAVLPLLNEPERSQAETMYQQSLTLFDRLAPQQRQNLLRWGVLNEPEEVE